MTYLAKHKRRRVQPLSLGGMFDTLFAPVANLLNPTTEMPEDFVGNVAALPVCPKTDQNGWCRNASGVAVKSAVNYTPPATTPAGTGYTGSSAQSIVDTLLGALISPSSPAPAGVVAPRAPGMSTGTKLAIAGAGVAVIALIAARR